jgi:hypothetical protein
MYDPKIVRARFIPTASPSGSSGDLVFDSTNDCLTFFNSDSEGSLQIGQEQWVRAINKTGSTIPTGTPFYMSGTDTGTNLPTIAPAKADSSATTFTAGVTTESIANNAVGRGTAFGVIHNIDTSAFSAGATVYLSATVAGMLTATPPTFPNSKSIVGTVLKSDASTGQLFVAPITTTSRMLSVRNPSTFTKSADTTLADVTGLSISVLAGGVYAFEAVLQINASAVGGYKFAIGGTATATSLLARIVANNVLTAVLNSVVTTLGTAVGAVAGTDVFVRIFGTIVVANAGTLTIQFAQNVASGASSVLANSAFQVQVVAN